MLTAATTDYAYAGLLNSPCPNASRSLASNLVDEVVADSDVRERPKQRAGGQPQDRSVARASSAP
jgi:hypothetical protein